jgi:hypothetical protein
MSVLTIRNGAYVPGTVQNITTSASSQVSSAVGANTSIIRVAVNQDTYVAFGSAPTANTACMLMAGGSSEFIAVQPGVTKVAVLQVSTSGIASITQLTGY